MKKFRLFSMLMATLIACMSFTACQKQESPATTAAQTQAQTQAETKAAEATEDTKEVKIAFILKTLSNEYWAAFNESLEKIAADKGVSITVFSVPDESDAQGQLKKFEDALLQEFDVICFSPISPANLNTAILEANKANIPVLCIDDLADVDDLAKSGGWIDVFVSADNIMMGKIGAEEIVKVLGDAGGEVGIIEGIPGVSGSEDRKVGAKEAFSKNPNIKVVSEQPANWDKLQALDVATNMIQSNPELKALHCANDTMALGAVEAVASAGKEGQIFIAGVDGTPEAISAIAAGKMVATALQGTDDTALASLEGALELAKNGGTNGGEMKTVFVNLVSVTKDNAESYK